MPTWAGHDFPDPPGQEFLALSVKEKGRPIGPLKFQHFLKKEAGPKPGLSENQLHTKKSTVNLR